LLEQLHRSVTENDVGRRFGMYGRRHSRPCRKAPWMTRVRQQTSTAE